MGDVAMVSPILESVVKKYPNKHFVVLTSNRFDAFFEHIDNVECICITKENSKNIITLYRLFKQINKQHEIDCVIDLHGVLRSKILSYFYKFKGVPIYFIDKNRKNKKALIEHTISNDNLQKKIIYSYKDTFEKAGMPVELEDKLNLQRRDISNFDSKYKKTTTTQELIGLAPFAQYDGKKMPENIVIKLLSKLCENPNYKILLFGGSDSECKLCEKWAAASENIISTVRVFSLSDELRLISNLDVMISMDSGGQHMASLVGVRAITIWGATHPSIGFLGFGQSYNDCIVSNLECTPCSVFGNKPCLRGDYKCLSDISIDKIISLI